jgi:hypothetical protein
VILMLSVKLEELTSEVYKVSNYLDEAKNSSVRLENQLGASPTLLSVRFLGNDAPD